MDAQEYLETLEDAEGLLNRLRALYEQYFQGFERLEPHVPRKGLERIIARLRRAPQRNTALRFRFNQLIQKHTTYQAYWRRVGRQIEEGTYLRHVMRARERRDEFRAAQHSQRPNSFEIDMDIDVDLDELSKEAEASVQKRAELARTKPLGNSTVNKAVTAQTPATNLPKMNMTEGTQPAPVRQRTPISTGKKPRPQHTAANADVDMRKVYDRYVAARRKNNERVDNVRYDSLEKNINKMMPKLKKKYGNQKIEFKVVVRNGRVGLKPVPKKG